MIAPDKRLYIDAIGLREGCCEMQKVKKVDLPGRYAKKINFTETCWLWTAATNKNGYGTYRTKEKLVLSHRYAWQFFNGDIPEVMFVLHKCDVRKCVNPDHLFLGTKRDNSLDMFAKGRNYNLTGEQHGNAKLTQIQVDEIRRLYIKGTKKSDFSQRGLAKKFNVSPGHIDRILKNKEWRKKELAQ